MVMFLKAKGGAKDSRSCRESTAVSEGLSADEHKTAVEESGESDVEEDEDNESCDESDVEERADVSAGSIGPDRQDVETSDGVHAARGEFSQCESSSREMSKSPAHDIDAEKTAAEKATEGEVSVVPFDQASTDSVANCSASSSASKTSLRGTLEPSRRTLALAAVGALALIFLVTSRRAA